MPLSVCHRTYKLVASTNIKEIQEGSFSQNLAFVVETFSINSICEFELIF